MGHVQGCRVVHADLVKVPSGRMQWGVQPLLTGGGPGAFPRNFLNSKTTISAFSCNLKQDWGGES